MTSVIILIQSAVAILLIGLILMQSKGVGLGKAWGGSGEFYKNRRGVEKVIFRATIVTAFLFFILSILSLTIS